MKPTEKCELCNDAWASYQLQTIDGKKEICKKCAVQIYKETINEPH